VSRLPIRSLGVATILCTTRTLGYLLSKSIASTIEAIRFSETVRALPRKTSD
jgi:hypothetical protein